MGTNANRSLRMLIVEGDEDNIKQQKTQYQHAAETSTEHELEEEMPRLTSSAMKQAKEPHVMKTQAYHKKRRLSLLVDTGGTLNFLDACVVKGLRCVMDHSKSIEVVLAYGTVMLSKGVIPQLLLIVQGHNFVVEVHVLPIIGYDLILGIPWLKKLGSIMWNFSKLTMEFNYEGTTCRIVGIEDVVTVVDENVITKMLEGNIPTTNVQCWLVTKHSTEVGSKEKRVVHPKLLDLIE